MSHNIAELFPFGMRVVHQQDGRNGYVIDWDKRNDLLVVECCKRDGTLAATRQSWRADLIRAVAMCDVGTLMQLRLRAPGSYPLPPQGVPAVPNVAASHIAKAAKPDMNQLLQFPKALEAAADVLAWAEQAKGYNFQSFKKLTPSQLRAALLRHTFQTGDHHALDDESKRRHAVHVLVNALMYVETILA